MPALAETLDNLGLLQKDTNQLLVSEKSYQEALEKYRKVAEKNPETYLPALAETLNNLGLLQDKTNHFSEAEKILPRSPRHKTKIS